MNSVVISRSGGSGVWMRGRAARTRCTMSSVQASSVFKTVSRAER
jgi:hypothetical protein